MRPKTPLEIHIEWLQCLIDSFPESSLGEYDDYILGLQDALGHAMLLNSLYE